jgi:glycosyltransferase involved in cell wall biosynthesis
MVSPIVLRIIIESYRPLRHKAPMKISVVIPAFNEAKLIGRCLAAMHEASGVFTALGWTNEVIVCDNNSTDDTARLARESGATVVFEPVNQISRARNRGAAAATGDWLLFLDADSFPSRELSADMTAAIGDARCLGGGANVCLEDVHGFAAWGVAFWNALSRLTHWAPGAFLFCDATAFRQVGGFNEELFVSEELDLSRRLKKLGRREGRRLVILHRHPLLTSGRKIGLYSRREYGALFRSFLLHPRRSARDATACGLWYDGRR